jgi:hypothetical protein
MVTIVSVFICNTLFLGLPSTNKFCMFFEVEKFVDDVEYKYKIMIGIVLCSLITYLAEKIIVLYITKYFDKRTKAIKDGIFS